MSSFEMAEPIGFARILCATDFSKFSFRAADYAVALARRYDGELHFLHVIPRSLLHPDLYPYLAEPVNATPELREKAHERLDAFAALCRAEDVRTRFSVREGTPARVILEASENEEADVICLGTHGRGGFERLVLGSVAERVLRKARCPVLTVSQPGQEETNQPAVFRNVICAIDFDTFSIRALDYALSLAQEAGGKLILVNVVEWLAEEPGWESRFSVPEYRKRMEENALKRLDEVVPEDARDWCDVETLATSGKPYREILELAKDKEADVVVMGVRGRNPLDRMLFGSTTQHVVRRSECPVLTVAGDERRW